MISRSKESRRSGSGTVISVSPASVHVGSAYARDQRADQRFARAGGGDVGRLDRDPVRVDDDAPHGRHGSSRPGCPGFPPARFLLTRGGGPNRPRSANVLRTP